MLSHDWVIHNAIHFGLIPFRHQVETAYEWFKGVLYLDLQNNSLDLQNNWLGLSPKLGHRKWFDLVWYLSVETTMKQYEGVSKRFWGKVCLAVTSELRNIHLGRLNWLTTFKRKEGWLD